MKAARRPNPRRRGYTILELLVVMTAVVILGSVAVPTIFGMQGDTRSKAGADMVRAAMNEARAKAMEDGQAYRLAVSSDQQHIRIAPDDDQAVNNNSSSGHDEGTGGPFVREENLPENVTASVLLGQNEQSTQDQAGWVRVATFLPDGTCREDSIEVELREPGVAPYVVRLRGLTGAVSVTRANSAEVNR